MPRFFFDVHDGTEIIDDVGEELPNLAAARQHALTYAGRLIADLSATFWTEGDWRIEVRDDRGLIFFTLLLVSCEAPVSGLVKQR